MRQSTEPHHPAFAGSQNGAGLTKREWFAGMALQGLLASYDAPGLTPRNGGQTAVAFADALIAALNERSES